jgi:hypothetical protein
MAGGQLQLSSLGFEDTLPDEETHDMILNTLSQRLDILFAKEVDE